MAKTMTMKVTGLKEIDDLLQRLPKSNRGKILRGSVRAAGGIMVEATRDNIDRIPDERLGRSGKERFKKSVGVVTSKSRRFEQGVYIGPRYGGVKHIAPDAHLFEFGTDDRYTADGRYRGKISPTPFVRPAWDSTKEKIINEARQQLVDRTINEAIKLRKL